MFFSFVRMLARRPFAIGVAIGLTINLSLVPFVRTQAVAMGTGVPMTSCVMDPWEPPEYAKELDSYVKAQQTIWANAFGRSDEPSANYQMLAGIAAPGLFAGQNHQGDAFWLEVKFCEFVELPQDDPNVLNMQATALTMVGRIIGPVGSVPVIGTVIGATNNGVRTETLWVGSTISAQAYSAFSLPGVDVPPPNGGGSGSGGGGGSDPCAGDCAQKCFDAAERDRDQALRIFALCMGVATAVFALAMLACGVSSLIIGIGFVIGATCSLIALAAYATAAAACSLTLAILLLGVAERLRDCLAACGCVLAEV